MNALGDLFGSEVPVSPREAKLLICDRRCTKSGHLVVSTCHCQSSSRTKAGVNAFSLADLADLIYC